VGQGEVLVVEELSVVVDLMSCSLPFFGTAAHLLVVPGIGVEYVLSKAPPVMANPQVLEPRGLGVLNVPVVAAMVLVWSVEFEVLPER